GSSGALDTSWFHGLLTGKTWHPPSVGPTTGWNVPTGFDFAVGRAVAGANDGGAWLGVAVGMRLGVGILSNSGQVVGVVVGVATLGGWIVRTVVAAPHAVVVSRIAAAARRSRPPTYRVRSGGTT